MHFWIVSRELVWRGVARSLAGDCRISDGCLWFQPYQQDSHCQDLSAAPRQKLPTHKPRRRSLHSCLGSVFGAVLDQAVEYLMRCKECAKPGMRAMGDVYNAFSSMVPPVHCQGLEDSTRLTQDAARRVEAVSSRALGIAWSCRNMSHHTVYHMLIYLDFTLQRCSATAMQLQRDFMMHPCITLHLFACTTKQAHHAAVWQQWFFLMQHCIPLYIFAWHSLANLHYTSDLTIVEIPISGELPATPILLCWAQKRAAEYIYLCPRYANAPTLAGLKSAQPRTSLSLYMARSCSHTVPAGSLHVHIQAGC
eukprot:scaffold17850_cov18-Tisochrysis_lutea.AAC.3